MTQTEKTPAFENQMSRLESILEKLSGQLPLEEALSLYEEADKLINHCESTLKHAEVKIEKLLSKRNADNEVVSLEGVDFNS